MTDDEILDLADVRSMKSVRVWCFSGDQLLRFARAIEQRSMINQKARWYQIGAESERHDIAKMVETYCGAWDDKGQALVQMIRSRGV